MDESAAGAVAFDRAGKSEEHPPAERHAMIAAHHVIHPLSEIIMRSILHVFITPATNTRSQSGFPRRSTTE
jgi:hypothetical protein